MKIQWNKVTWYSKTLALALFIIVPCFAFGYGVQYGEAVSALNNPQSGIEVTGTAAALNSYYENVSEWQSDNRSDAGFTIAYPIDFPVADNNSGALSADWRLNADNTLGVKAFTLTIPKAFEPQTNFVDATITVGKSGNNLAVAQCLTPDQSGGPAVTTSSASIDGSIFTVFHASDAGAGNFYETTSYRTVHAGQCYAIEYTIHSSQIANYPASYNLQPFNAKTATDLLDRIAGTFTFK